MSVNGIPGTKWCANDKRGGGGKRRGGGVQVGPRWKECDNDLALGHANLIWGLLSVAQLRFRARAGKKQGPE